MAVEIGNFGDIAEKVKTEWGAVERSKSGSIDIGPIHKSDAGMYGIYFYEPTGLLESTEASCAGTIEELANAIGSRGFALKYLGSGEEGGQKVTYHEIVHLAQQIREESPD